MRRVLALGLIVITACGGNGSPSVSTVGDPTTTVGAAAGTTSEPATTSTISTTSTSPVTSTTVPAVDVEFSRGDVVGPGVFEVALGARVEIWVLSDVDDEMHVHGYDLFFDLEAGVPFHLDFLADVPGVFEVEVHTGHTHLFDIQVSN